MPPRRRNARTTSANDARASQTEQAPGAGDHAGLLTQPNLAPGSAQCRLLDLPPELLHKVFLSTHPCALPQLLATCHALARCVMAWAPRRVLRRFPTDWKHRHFPAVLERLVPALEPPDLELVINPMMGWALPSLGMLRAPPPAPLRPWITRLSLERLALSDQDLTSLGLHEWPHLHTLDVLGCTLTVSKATKRRRGERRAATAAAATGTPAAAAAGAPLVPAPAPAPAVPPAAAAAVAGAPQAGGQGAVAAAEPAPAPPPAAAGAEPPGPPGPASQAPNAPNAPRTTIPALRSPPGLRTLRVFDTRGDALEWLLESLVCPVASPHLTTLGLPRLELFESFDRLAPNLRHFEMDFISSVRLVRLVFMSQVESVTLRCCTDVTLDLSHMEYPWTTLRLEDCYIPDLFMLPLKGLKRLVIQGMVWGATEGDDHSNAQALAMLKERQASQGLEVSVVAERSGAERHTHYWRLPAHERLVEMEDFDNALLDFVLRACPEVTALSLIKPINGWAQDLRALQEHPRVATVCLWMRETYLEVPAALPPTVTAVVMGVYRHGAALAPLEPFLAGLPAHVARVTLLHSCRDAGVLAALRRACEGRACGRLELAEVFHPHAVFD